MGQPSRVFTHPLRKALSTTTSSKEAHPDHPPPAFPLSPYRPSVVPTVTMDHVLCTSALYLCSFISRRRCFFFSRFISQRGTELKRLRGVPQGNDQNASPPGLVPKTSLTTNGCSWVPLVPSWCQRQTWHTVGSLGYILTARRSVFTFWLLPLRPLSLRLQQSDNNENNITWGGVSTTEK